MKQETPLHKKQNYVRTHPHETPKVDFAAINLAKKQDAERLIIAKARRESDEHWKIYPLEPVGKKYNWLMPLIASLAMLMGIFSLVNLFNGNWLSAAMSAASCVLLYLAISSNE